MNEALVLKPREKECLLTRINAMCYVWKGEFAVTRSFYGKDFEVRLEGRERERGRENGMC